VLARLGIGRENMRIAHHHIKGETFFTKYDPRVAVIFNFIKVFIL
jgi:hypothetical protein